MKNVAVLFADISGSTRLYNKLGDQAARGIVDECLGRMIGTLEPHKGRVIKTMGDEVMCVFPSADAAVMAASAMQASVAEKPPRGYPVSIHAGMHYGPVLLESDDVFGDTVNSAAYLCAVAAADQILITDTTVGTLSQPLKACVRPVFYAVLKGNTEESTVYQILWRRDNFDITDANLRRRNIIPADLGSMVVRYRSQSARADHQRTALLLGRTAEADVVVDDKYASRRHAMIAVQRTHFYLVDQSINGTYVRLESGEEVHVLRRELLLDGSGMLSLGRSFSQQPVDVIHFSRDRRALYRV